MSKKTKVEIAAEIARLEEAKQFAPRRTMFGDDNHEKIDRQIEYLRGDIDMTAPESERSALVYLDSASIDATEHVGPRNQRMRAQVRGAWTPYRRTWSEVASAMAEQWGNPAELAISALRTKETNL